MVAGHGMNDLFGLAVLAKQLDTDLEVGALHFPIDRLTDVVEQSTALGNLNVRLELGGHVGRQKGYLLAVLKHVLTIGGTEAKTPEKFHQFRVNVRQVELE